MSLPEKPLTRRETYLAKAAGQSVTLPEEDLTREEQYYRAIAEGGGGGGTQADWSQTDTDAPDYIKNKPTLGTAAAKDSTNAVTENSTDLVESGAVKTAIDTAVSSVDLSGKADKVSSAINGNLAALDANGNLADSGSKAADFIISGSATGTALTLTDSADARVQGLAVYGRSHKSKNLFVFLTEDSFTFNGINFSTNRIAGTLTANGTATQLDLLLLGANEPRSEVILSGCPLSDGSFNLEAKNSSGTPETNSRDTGNGSLVYNGAEFNRIFLRVSQGTVFNNAIFKPMVCTSADYEADPTFEPYGIHSVGDDGLTVQTTGKNLLDESLFIVGGIKGDTHTITPSATTWMVTKNCFLVKAGTYTVSSSVLINHKINVQAYTSEELTTNAFIRKITDNSLLPQTFTLSEDTYIAIDIEVGTSVTPNDLANSKIQLELGSTVTAYEPYRSTSADYTTGLPLCSIPDTTIHDELNAEKEVVKQCGAVELDDLTFTYANSLFSATVTGAAAGAALCEKYTYKAITSALSELADGEFTMYSDSGTVKVYINDTNYSDAATFTTAVTGVKLIYPLETPTTTPLTDTEISAFRALRTFDSTTNINITDEPEFTIDYLKNTDNGKAVSRVVDLLQGADIKAFTYTGTGTVNHSTTFPEVPTMVLAMFGQHTFSSNTWSVSSRPFVWGVRPVFVDWCAVGGTSNGNQMMPATYNGKEISFSGMGISDPGAALNAEGETYTVYYI